jgi:hypothetical protein
MVAVRQERGRAGLGGSQWEGEIMLIQLHHQFKDGHTEMVSQGEWTGNDALRLMIEDAKKSNPPPDGAIWMVCNEKSEKFVWTTTKEETERVIKEDGG